MSYRLLPLAGCVVAHGIDHEHDVVPVHGVIRRAIDKWLNAGVLEDGVETHPDEGTPQGGVVSPVLANVYLHEVLDLWFEHEVKPRLHGDATLVRYADDFVIVFEWESDARRVLEVLPKRFGKYSLTLHPEKTRLLKFQRPRPDGRRDDDDDGPGSFDFLGLTHHWRRSLKGTMVVCRRTMRTRFSRGLARINDWCRQNLHLPIGLQQEQLASKLRGHYNYYGLTRTCRSSSTSRIALPSERAQPLGARRLRAAHGGHRRVVPCAPRR